MSLLALILIALALIVGLCVFYAAWELSSGRYELEPQSPANKEEPGESKEPKDSPGSG